MGSSLGEERRGGKGNGMGWDGCLSSQSMAPEVSGTSSGAKMENEENKTQCQHPSYRSQTLTLSYLILYSTIAPSAPAPGNGTDHLSRPVLEQVGNVSDGVAVGQEIPAPCAVAVVVEPGAKDQVGGYAEEKAV